MGKSRSVILVKSMGMKDLCQEILPRDPIYDYGKCLHFMAFFHLHFHSCPPRAGIHIHLKAIHCGANGILLHCKRTGENLQYENNRSLRSRMFTSTWGSRILIPATAGDTGASPSVGLEAVESFWMTGRASF
jgi:hypothetical protein